MEILSVPSISIEVLELANRQILKEYHGVRHISELLNEISPSFKHFFLHNTSRQPVS